MENIIKKAFKIEVLETYKLDKYNCELCRAYFQESPWSLCFIKNIFGEVIAVAYSELLIYGAWKSYIAQKESKYE